VQVGTNIKQFPGTWCFFDFYSHAPRDQAFSILYAIIGLLVIVLTALGNVSVMVFMLRMRRISQNIGKSSSGRTMKNMTSEMHMILFLAAIIVVFGICYLPLMVG
jgi:prostaglandin E receptor 4